MKRLKDLDQVAHYWANKVTDNGRASNLYFEGDRIYSYGGHFIVGEHLPDGSVAITTRSYSVTTSNHIGTVRQAARHLKVRRVPLGNSFYEMAGDLSRQARNWIDKAKKARLYKAEFAGNAFGLIDEFIDYCNVKDWDQHWNLAAGRELLDLKAEAKALSEETPEQMAKRKELERKRKERLAAEKAEADRIAKLEAAEKIELWRTGARVYGLPRFDSAMLRLMPVPHPASRDDFVVETSWGAEVPATHAWRLWPLVQLVRHRGEGRTDMSKRVGHYVLTNISAAGDITVGCHVIKYEELERMHVEMLAAGFEELPQEVEDEPAV